MKNEYNISLLQGNHGIWLFVRKDDAVIFEQSGMKTVDQALDFAKEIIKAEEESERLNSILEQKKNRID